MCRIYKLAVSVAAVLVVAWGVAPSAGHDEKKEPMEAAIQGSDGLKWQDGPRPFRPGRGSPCSKGTPREAAGDRHLTPVPMATIA